MALGVEGKKDKKGGDIPESLVGRLYPSSTLKGIKVYSEKSTLKGCLPEPEIDSAALGFCEIPASLFVNSSPHDES
jgi:hypothetical protein